MLDYTKWQESLDRQLVAQTLIRAHDYIEEYGWAQHFGEYGKPVCALKAITMQYEPGSAYDDPIGKAAIQCLRGVVGPDIIMWVDTDGRTKREVLDALKRAAINAANGE